MLFIVPVLYFFVPQALASCPPLQSETVRVVCWLGERAVDCMKDPVPPGTLARFFCMPGHQLSLPNMPPARFQSRCGSDSAWSMQPFSCQPVTCPPLQLRTVVADCTLAGQPVPCKEQPVSPGTVATFKCKPGHKIKFGYSRDPNFQSQCGTDGLWSEGPFRCEPESSASAATPAPVTCPPLESKTVLAECRFQGRPFDCTARSVPAGTTARFRCKPLHQFLFGYLPASSFESQCGADGQWTVQPFRCEPICGQPTGKGISFIRDGNVTASAADFPWHVVIYDLTKDLQQICGGTLISPKYFVSAAHCFHDGKKMSPEAIYRAGFGKIKRNVSEQEPNEQYRELEKIYIKDYGGSKELYSNDISLVELRDEVDITSTTMPVCVDWGLELPNLRHGELGAVVGFGDTAERAHDSLRFALLPFIKSAECKRHVTDSLAVYNKLPDKFCIGFVNRTTVAKGDSGGGIAFPNEERAWYLRGVVSLGSSQETTYSFFTNLTTFVPWMSGLIQLGEVSGRRCGVDVNQASIVSGAAAGQFDFPWEVDVYYKQTSNHDFERLTTGALIGPNLIITRAKSVTSTGQPIDLSEYPSTWLRVTPRREAHFKSLEKAINVSEVVRGFFPSDVLAASGLFYNILLLELKQPVHLMPVCLDWTGGALLKKERLATALSDYETDNSTVWTRLPILNTTSCKQLSSAQPGSHHVCTVQEGPKQLRAHNSLYVFAGSTWFLRGVGSDSVSTPDGTVTAYTDMSDRGVRQWLSKTSDMIGKPTCGNVNLCEPLSAGLSLRGHMPWTVAVVVGSGSGSRTESGMLIQPNAVLTDSAAVVNLSGWNGDGIVPTVSTDSITVLWTAADGSVKRSQVVRVLVRESAEVGKDGRPLLDVALLELRPDQAVPATPICLDLSGNVLQPLATGQLGLVEAWSSWGPTNHSLVSVPFMGPAECSTQLRQSSNRSRESNEFCTSATPGVLDPTAVLGGGFLVSSGSQWYLQGLYTGFARLRHRTVGLASDFRDDALKGWMREELRKIKPVNLKSPDDSGPKNCVGGRPTATECGLFNSKDELQDENDFLYKASRNRMEWNVQVHVYRNNPVWEVRGGVLIRTSMVVTSALNMFSRKSNESSGPGEAIRTSNVLVKYITADGRGPFSVEVRRIHLKERCPGCGPRAEAPPELHYDVALLELSSPVTLMPVCVPKPGWVTAPLNSLTEGLVEVWDDAYSSQRTLVPTLFRTLGACRIASPVDFLNAEFCTEPTSGATRKTPSVGAAFSVLATGGAGGWFLRGIQGTPWNSTKGGTVPVFYNVDEPGLREWLNEKMQLRTSDGSIVPLPEPKLQPLVLSEPTHTSKCGQTNLPLFSLVYNHTLPGPLPWSVAIYIGDNDKTFISGVLLRDDVVITDAHMLVVPGSAWNDSVVVRTVDPAEVRVMWVSHTGRRYGSQVVAVHARERDRGAYQTSRTFDVALLRLKKPFLNSGAACWDHNLPALERYQLGVTDAWDVSILDFQSDVLATPYVNLINDHCIFKNTPIPRVKMSMEKYCTGPVRVAVKTGTGFLIRKGDSWFVHGILSTTVASGDDRWVITDLAEEGVSLWLREKLAEESVDPTLHPEAPAEPARRSECGRTTIPLSSLAENVTLADHMPWTVVVYRKDPKGTMRMSPGVLVRDDAVLTDASLLVEPSGEGSDEMRAVDTQSAFVVWFTPSGRRLRSNVLRIFVGEKSHRLGSSNATFNLALLRLGTPFLNSSVACLDLDNTLPGLVEGKMGVMETWNGDPFWFSNNIVATTFVSNADCRLVQKSANVTSDMLCTKGTRALERTLKPRKGVKVLLDVKPGTGFFERSGDAWFVRGIVAFSGKSGEDRLAVVVLADSSTRTWLREKMSLGDDAAHS